MKLNIGENIRKNRTRLGWTQTQLAERLGTSVQSVSRWESGGGYPDMELLPELARAFGVSVDELMGYGEPEKKLTQAELNNLMYETFREEEFSPERAAEILRKIRLDYLDDAIHVLNLKGVSPDRLGGSREVMQELYLLTEEYRKRGAYPSESGELIQYLAIFEQDDAFLSVVEKYQQNEGCDLSRLGLHLERARAHKCLDLFERLGEEKKLKAIKIFFDDCELPLTEYRQDGAYDCKSLALDPHESRKRSEKKLRLLHALRDADVKEKYPLSGDGVLDIWSPTAIRIGIQYAAQLAAEGMTERACTVLEDVAGLIEQASDFASPESYRQEYTVTKCPVVPCRAVDLSHLQVYRVLQFAGMPLEDKQGVVLIAFQVISAAGSTCDWWMDLIDLNHCLTCLTKLHPAPTKSFCVPWLDPIREHPRYKAVVERIQVCKDRLTNTKEERA